MGRRHRELNVFSLSMLDVIAGAMAAFLVITIILLPYYKKEHVDYQAIIAEQRAALAAAQAELEAEQQAALAAREAADAAEAERDQAREQAAQAGAERDALLRRTLDLMLVLDTTGSMADELARLQLGLKDLVRVLQALSKDLRVGVVAYRDVDTPRYQVLPFPLTPMEGDGRARLESFVDALDLGPGQTWEESIHAGLAAALAQPWRADAEAVIVVIGDARAHAAHRAQALAAASAFRARSERNRLSVISKPADRGPYAGQEPQRVPDQRDVDFFAELARRGGGVHLFTDTPMVSGIVLSIYQ